VSVTQVGEPGGEGVVAMDVVTPSREWVGGWVPVAHPLKLPVMDALPVPDVHMDGDRVGEAVGGEVRDWVTVPVPHWVTLPQDDALGLPELLLDAEVHLDTVGLPLGDLDGVEEGEGVGGEDALAVGLWVPSLGDPLAGDLERDGEMEVVDERVRGGVGETHWEGDLMRQAVGVKEVVGLTERTKESEGSGQRVGLSVGVPLTLVDPEMKGEAVVEGHREGDREGAGDREGDRVPLVEGDKEGELEDEPVGKALMEMGEEEGARVALMEPLVLMEGATEAELKGDRVVEGSPLLTVTDGVKDALLETLRVGIGLKDTEGLPDVEPLKEAEGEMEGVRVVVRVAEGERVRLSVAVAERVGSLGVGEPERELDMVGERERLGVAVTQEERVRVRVTVGVTERKGEEEGRVVRVGVGVAKVEMEGDTLALTEALGELESVVEEVNEGEREEETVGDRDGEEVRHREGERVALGGRDALALPLPLRLSSREAVGAAPVGEGEVTKLPVLMKGVKVTVMERVRVAKGLADTERLPDTEAQGLGEWEVEGLELGLGVVVEPTERLRVPVAHSVDFGERDLERVGEFVGDRERLTVIVTHVEAVKVRGVVGEREAVGKEVKVEDREGVMD
jgi:hypothetical protein